jgi:hypothetical protein
MARDDGDYVVRGLRDKDGVLPDSEWDRGLDSPSSRYAGQRGC